MVSRREIETSSGGNSNSGSSDSSSQFNTKLDAKGNVESHGRRRGRSLASLHLRLLTRLLRFDDSGGGQGDMKLGISSSPGTRFEF